MLLPTRRRRSPLFNPLASAALFGQTCAMKNSTPSPRLNALATAVPGHDIHRAFIDWATPRSEEHTSELQSLMRISYAVFCLKKKNQTYIKMKHSMSNK